MRQGQHIRWATRQVSFAVLLVLAACATQQGADVPGPSQSVIADTRDFTIIRSGNGDTYASLAAEYLGDAAAAPVLQDINGRRLSPGGLLVVPKRPINPSGVEANGYQVVPILCYHQFKRGRTKNRMQVSGAAFEAQMRYLKDNAYRVITLGELEGFLNGKRQIPKRAVVVTIDDGYRSTYEIAYPILRRLGLRATLFVYTDFVGGGLSLTWDQMREMRQSGVIDIQSHSKSHTSLSPNGSEKPGSAYSRRVEKEIDIPHRIFAEKFGAANRHFAYPYGDTSEEAITLLQRRSYTLAATVQRGANASFTHPLLLRRNMVYSDHGLKDLRRFLKVFTSANLR